MSRAEDSTERAASGRFMLASTAESAPNHEVSSTVRGSGRRGVQANLPELQHLEPVVVVTAFRGGHPR